MLEDDLIVFLGKFFNGDLALRGLEQAHFIEVGGQELQSIHDLDALINPKALGSPLGHSDHFGNGQNNWTFARLQIRLAFLQERFCWRRRAMDDGVANHKVAAATRDRIGNGESMMGYGIGWQNQCKFCPN